ncbi:MAG: hypothetical protein RLZ98_3175 [Pseudomonadota bacterium]
MRGLVAVAAFYACTCLTTPATAEPPASGAHPGYELWSGIDTTANATSVYAGFNLAPFTTLNSDGLRLRAVAGGGGYDYTAGVPFLGSPRHSRIHGRSAFVDLLVGYQWTVGPATLKAFAGGTWSEHTLSPFDPANDVFGEKFGVKAILEGWLNVTDRSWASADLSFSTAHGDFSSRLRYGYRLMPKLSVGPEAGGYGNREFTGGRIGAFARYEWTRGEIALSGGISGDIEQPDSPYATLNVVQKF